MPRQASAWLSGRATTSANSLIYSKRTAIDQDNALLPKCLSGRIMATVIRHLSTGLSTGPVDKGFRQDLPAMQPCGKAALARRGDEQAAKQDGRLGQLHQGTGGIACEPAEPLKHAPPPDEQ